MSSYCTTVARPVNLRSLSHKSLTGFSRIYQHESFVPFDGLEVHPPETQHGSSSCPHLSVIDRLARHGSRVCLRLRLLEHLRSQPLLRVHEDAVSYFRPEVVHVYVVMTTRRQA